MARARLARSRRGCQIGAVTVNLARYETGAPSRAVHDDALADLQAEDPALFVANHPGRKAGLPARLGRGGKGGALQRMTAECDPRAYRVWPIAAPTTREGPPLSVALLATPAGPARSRSSTAAGTAASWSNGSRACHPGRMAPAFTRSTSSRRAAADGAGHRQALLPHHPGGAGQEAQVPARPSMEAGRSARRISATAPAAPTISPRWPTCSNRPAGRLDRYPDDRRRDRRGWARREASDALPVIANGSTARLAQKAFNEVKARSPGCKIGAAT